VRRLAGVVLVCASFALIGASPSPRPSPVPARSAPASPSPTATPDFSNVPTVLVFPFESPSDIDQKYGSAIAKIYSDTFSGSGGLKVLPIPAKPVKADQYLSQAQAQHADYYVSGFVQPIGGQASIVAHVVDVNSNITVYSATTMISSVPDVASQALNARTVIMQSAGEQVSAIEPSSAPETPAPTSSGASVSLDNMIGGLFKGKGGKNVAAATPTPSPKPPRGVIVAKISGNASAQDLSVGTDDLYRAMNVYYTTRLVQTASTDVSSQANALCGPQRDNTVASGTLNVQHVGGMHPHDVYTFTLTIYACFGVTLYSESKTDPNRTKVIQEAVKAYAEAHPENNG
jgi:hypothetical protein